MSPCARARSLSLWRARARPLCVCVRARVPAGSFFGGKRGDHATSRVTQCHRKYTLSKECKMKRANGNGFWCFNRTPGDQGDSPHNRWPFRSFQVHRGKRWLHEILAAPTFTGIAFRVDFRFEILVF
eukprot:jgi/Botrbrau1/7980/Bobra.384_2s0008.1